MNRPMSMIFTSGRPQQYLRSVVVDLVVSDPVVVGIVYYDWNLPVCMHVDILYHYLTATKVCSSTFYCMLYLFVFINAVLVGFALFFISNILWRI